MSHPSFPHSEMSPNENLHFAIGMIAYTMAYADGTVQKEEHDRFRSIVDEELKLNNEAFNVADIIFQIMERGPHDRESTYNMAMHQVKNNSHYLSPALKAKFLKVIEKIAKAYPPVTSEEKALYERFSKDIEPLHGDPVYYSK